MFFASGAHNHKILFLASYSRLAPVMKQNVSPGKWGRLISNLLFFPGCGGTTEKKVKLLLSFLFHIHGKKRAFSPFPSFLFTSYSSHFLVWEMRVRARSIFFSWGCMGAERPLDYVLRAERDPRWGPWTPKRRFFLLQELRWKMMCQLGSREVGVIHSHTCGEREKGLKKWLPSREASIFGEWRG